MSGKTPEIVLELWFSKTGVPPKVGIVGRGQYSAAWAGLFDQHVILWSKLGKIHCLCWGGKMTYDQLRYWVHQLELNNTSVLRMADV